MLGSDCHILVGGMIFERSATSLTSLQFEKHGRTYVNPDMLVSLLLVYSNWSLSRMNFSYLNKNQRSVATGEKQQTQ